MLPFVTMAVCQVAFLRQGHLVRTGRSVAAVTQPSGVMRRRTRWWIRGVCTTASVLVMLPIGLLRRMAICRIGVAMAWRTSGSRMRLTLAIR